MEEADELVPDPDARGLLDLTNRAWVNLDPKIWTMSLTLISLDVSYNHLHDIPPQIGELVLLKEFRASFNKLVAIPPEMGRLKRLRKLIVNGNRISQIPEDIGRLELLEELVLSENSIELLPGTISKMAALRILKLQNNKIKKLPCELAEVLTLEILDCSNNKNLSMIPPATRGDTEGILFICRIHRDYKTLMEEMNVTNTDLSKHAQYLEHEQLILKETIGDFKIKIDDLRRHIPKRVLKKIDKEMEKEAAGEARGITATCDDYCAIM